MQNIENKSKYLIGEDFSAKLVVSSNKLEITDDILFFKEKTKPLSLRFDINGKHNEEEFKLINSKLNKIIIHWNCNSEYKQVTLYENAKCLDYNDGILTIDIRSLQNVYGVLCNPQKSILTKIEQENIRLELKMLINKIERFQIEKENLRFEHSQNPSEETYEKIIEITKTIDTLQINVNKLQNRLNSYKASWFSIEISLTTNIYDDWRNISATISIENNILKQIEKRELKTTLKTFSL